MSQCYLKTRRLETTLLLCSQSLWVRNSDRTQWSRLSLVHKPGASTGKTQGLGATQCWGPGSSESSLTHMSGHWGWADSRAGTSHRSPCTRCLYVAWIPQSGRLQGLAGFLPWRLGLPSAGVPAMRWKLHHIYELASV